ncbi:MAG: flap endonuclease-1 [Candidatus Heimdallarchaeaceae archaeon]
MGVKKLSDLVKGEIITLEQLRRKKLAVDAYIVIYQFLASIRGFDGSLFTDADGVVTSHLSGLLYRNSRLLEKGIQPIYVFDGAPSKLKKEELRRRGEIKKKAREEMEEARERGDIERARQLAQRTSKLTPQMIEDSKNLLRMMGIPVIEAPQEGEAQAAYLAKQNRVWGVASQDYDSILFDAPILVRNLTFSGKRKMYGKEITINIEVYKTNEILKKLQLTREQLIDMAILIGTDFNPDGVKGVGPITAHKLIKKYGKLEEALANESSIYLDADYEAIREIFLNPVITDEYEIKFGSIDIDAVVEFLCNQRNFSKERVVNTLSRAKRGQEKALKQRSLDSFFS